jgi:hypothetical protein
MNKVHPDWLTRDDLPLKEWEVQRGSAVRGDAWTNITDGKMRIPLDSSALSRAVRIHEAIHAKVSPASLVIPDGFDVDEGVLRCAEEVRVNVLGQWQGFPMDSLSDGSEKVSAERCVQANDLEGVRNLIVSTYGTKVNAVVMRAINKACKEHSKPKVAIFAKEIRAILKDTVRSWTKWHQDDLGSTDPSEVSVDGDTVEVPDGYFNTLRLAARLTGSYNERPKGEDGGEPWKPGEGSEPLPEGAKQFADPIIDRLPMPERVAGRMGRKRIPSDMGVNPRRIHRMMTDPERRIFDRRARSLGGVVLIDQSGSMQLSTDDLWLVIKAAPGCTIIGYSHAPRNKSNTPNIWVLADNGKVVTEVPSGNGGNGVDGPALLFALSKRKKGDPFVWVCDGHVTDSDDDTHPDLDRFCVDVAKKHRIHMVHDVEHAVLALEKIARGDRLECKLVGPLERYDR